MNDPDLVDELLDEQPALMKTTEVSKLLRVTSKTVFKWIRESKLKSLSLGPRTTLIRKEDLRSFLLHSDELDD